MQPLSCLQFACLLVLYFYIWVSFNYDNIMSSLACMIIIKVRDMISSSVYAHAHVVFLGHYDNIMSYGGILVPKV